MRRRSRSRKSACHIQLALESLDQRLLPGEAFHALAGAGGLSLAAQPRAAGSGAQAGDSSRVRLVDRADLSGGSASPSTYPSPSRVNQGEALPRTGYAAAGATPSASPLRSATASALTIDLESPFDSSGLETPSRHELPSAGGLGTRTAGSADMGGTGAGSTAPRASEETGQAVGSTSSSAPLQATAANLMSAGQIGDVIGVLGGSHQGPPPPSTGFPLGPTVADFNTTPYTLFGGATIDALATFTTQVSGNSSTTQGDSTTFTTTGIDAGGVSYSATTTETYSLTITETVTASGWTYEEAFAYTYDTVITPARSAGVATHAWGTSGYHFAASSAGNQLSLQLDLNLTDHDTGSQTITSSANGISKSTVWGWQDLAQYNRTVTSQTTQGSGVVSGTDSGSGTASMSSTGSGTYRWSNTDPATGYSESVSGTWNDHVNTWLSQGYSTTQAKAANGTITRSGMATLTQGSSTPSSYSGSGTITQTASGGGATESYSGTLQESGSDTASDQYTTNSTFTNLGQWLETSGSGSSSSSGSAVTSYSGSGTYADSYSGALIRGTLQSSGNDTSTYGYSTAATLGPGGAWSQTGSGQEVSTQSAYDSFSGSGSYTQTTSGSDTVSGTIWESGGDGQSSSYTTNYGLGASGTWQAVGGSGSGSGSGFGRYSYSASGTYSYGITGGTVRGTNQSSGYDNTTYNNSFSATLSSGGAWVQTGTETDTETGGAYDSYSASGSYTLNSGSGGSGSGSFSGTYHESGSDGETYGYTTNFATDRSGNWKPVSGSGSGSGSGSSNAAYSGTGTYSYNIVNGTVAGTYQAVGSDASTDHFSFTATLGSNGAWVQTGSGQSTETGSASDSFSGSGSYTQTTSGSGVPTSAFAGTFQESGRDADNYGYTTNFNLDGSGTWQAVGGSGSGSGSGSYSLSYSGTGTFSDGIVGGTVRGTTQASGRVNDTYTTSFTATLSPGGAWVQTGSGQGVESGTGSDSYSGSGTYTQTAASGAQTSSFTGTAWESGSDSASYNSTTTLSLVNNAWQAVNGSGSGSGSGATQFSYSGSGTYSYGITNGTVHGTNQASGYDNATYNDSFTATLSPTTGLWVQTGTGQTVETGGNSDSYSGSASFTQPTSGNGSFNGTFRESGSDGETHGYTTNYRYGAGGAWQAVSGSGSGAASGSYNSSYSGSGTYADTLHGGTVRGTIQGSGSTSSNYNDSYSANLGAGGTWSYSGTGRDTWSQTAAASFSGSGSYTSGYTHGTVQESGSDFATAQSSLGYTLGSGGAWTATSGSGTTSGSGAYHSGYSGTGTHSGTSSSGTTTTSLNQTWQENGQEGATYQYGTTSTYGSGRWTSTGSASTSGSGAGSSSYAGTTSYTDNYSSSYSTSGSSGSTSRRDNTSDSVNQSGRWSYNYNTLSTLAADGSVTNVTTSSASGSSSGSHTYSGSGSYDWTYDYNQFGQSGHQENHQHYTQSLTETVQSQWQENYTATTAAGKTTSVGSGSGGTTASGRATFSASGNGVTNSTTGTSQYHDTWSFSSNTNDNYNYNSGWTHTSNASGSQSSSSTASNHMTGGVNESSVDSWWSVAGSAHSSGGHNTPYTNSYDQTSSAGGFSSGAYFAEWNAPMEDLVLWHHPAASGDGWWASYGNNQGYGANGFAGFGYAFHSYNALSNPDTGSPSGGTGTPAARGGDPVAGAPPAPAPNGAAPAQPPKAAPKTPTWTRGKMDSSPINKSWTQQDILDYFDNTASQGLSPEDRDKARTQLVQLFATANNTKHGVEVNRCVKWVTDVLTNAPRTTNVILIETAEWDSPAGLPFTEDWWLGHQAIKVTLPNGAVFYLDDALIGGVGNKEHIFGPSDLPSYYLPPKAYHEKFLDGLSKVGNMLSEFLTPPLY